MTQGLVLSGQIIAFLEGLHLAGGDHDCEPFKVLDWERAFIEGAFAPDAEVSALSIARGNGKSCLLAGVGIEIQQVGIGIWDWAMRKSDVGTAIR